MQTGVSLSIYLISHYLNNELDTVGRQIVFHNIASPAADVLQTVACPAAIEHSKHTIHIYIHTFILLAVESLM